MKTLEMSKANESLAEYARRMRKDPLVVTVDGKPFSALVPIENADRETVALSTSPNFIALIERSRARHKREGGMSIQEMRRRLKLK